MYLQHRSSQCEVGSQQVGDEQHFILNMMQLHEFLLIHLYTLIFNLCISLINFSLVLFPKDPPDIVLLYWMQNTTPFMIFSVTKYYL